MRILITGANGFLGTRLAQKLISQGQISLDGSMHDIQELILVDKNPFTAFYGAYKNVVTLCYNFCDPAALDIIFAKAYDVVFHLAAIVSGQAERNLQLGYTVNVQATWEILNRIAEHKYTRFFMTSSIAVFGAPIPQLVPDLFPCLPASSYGAQKAISELYVLDYSRRKLCDGRMLRLPTIVVRSDTPNAATSSFVSSIIREPLNQRHASCPVPKDSKLWILSPDDAIKSILYATDLEECKISNTRIINPIGLSVSVQQILDVLIQIKGKEILHYIQFTQDSFIESIVLSWPSQFESKTARELGFPPIKNIEALIKEYKEYNDSL